MPIHDWSRVSAGVFHDFHSGWIIAIRNLLNSGLLPAEYYAMAEQVAGDVGPDALTLQSVGSNGKTTPGEPNGATAVAVAPPKVRFTASAEMDFYTRKQRTLVIRHSSDDRVIALVEIVSPGNKSKRPAIRSFVEKVVGALAQGYQLLIIDVQRPTPRDPQGIHGAIWEAICDDSYTAPPDKPLTLVAYTAGQPVRAYVEPVAVGDSLPEMPLFLDPGFYIPVPLEKTYLEAYRGVPQRWRSVLDDLKAALADQTDEVQRRKNLLTALQKEYLLSHDNLTPAITAGTEPPPSEWVNRRLKELGESWRVPDSLDQTELIE